MLSGYTPIRLTITSPCLFSPPKYFFPFFLTLCTNLMYYQSKISQYAYKEMHVQGLDIDIVKIWLNRFAVWLFFFFEKVKYLAIFYGRGGRNIRYIIFDQQSIFHAQLLSFTSLIKSIHRRKIIKTCRITIQKMVDNEK